MVRDQLTKEMVEKGKLLVRRLLKTDLQVTAAIWLYYEEPEKWRLMIATPKVREKGPRFVYSAIQDIVRNGSEDYSPVSLSDITVVKPDNQTVQLIRKVFDPTGEIAEIRFTGNAIDTHYIEDALIYYLA